MWYIFVMQGGVFYMIKTKQTVRRTLLRFAVLVGIGFFTVSCEDIFLGMLFDYKTLEGDITTIPHGTTYTYTRLTAVYSRAESESLTYQWKKDGKAIKGATSQTYKPDTTGSYTVTVSASGYYSKTSASVSVIK